MAGSMMTTTEHLLASSYDVRLVALSVLIAVVASYAALDLAGRVTSARGTTRVLWLTVGAIAMGLGVWSMHYIGMLAFHLPVQVQYDWPTVLVSLLAAILAAAVALFVVSRPEMGIGRAVVGSVFMGGGIAAMHYTGMAAMRLPATSHYSTGLVALSVVLAIVISLVALWLSFRVREETTAWSWRKGLSALVMGAAIPVMHYTGMAAAHFSAAPDAHVEYVHAIGASSLSVTGITSVTLLVLGLVVVTALADRRLSLHRLELEASQRHHRIIETALDAFIGMDAHGLVTDWNAQAERTFGWSRADVLGRSFADMMIPHRDRDTHADGLWQFATTGEGPVLNRRIEITALHRDGHEFPIELAICPIDWADTHHFAAFVRDVTERRQAQQALARKVDELARSNAELEQFAYVASHDLQEPLRMVASYTQLLARRYQGRLDADADEFIGFAVDGAARMQTLIQDLLAYSRLSTRGQSFTATDATAACDAALRNLRGALAETKGVVSVEPLPTVLADSTQLTQLLQNLIGNAIKYCDHRTPKITVAARRDGDQAVFSVNDNGIGIEPQYFDRIFQMFQRLHTRDSYSGTGIGLALCRKIVERHGGRIWVESRLGEGSTFLFTIPRAGGREA
jgi:two-component system sensor histidine kinase/response regulator